MAPLVVLLGIAAALNGLLAGASLDQSIEQLPARHRIGVRRYLDFTHAAHMANGRFWLIPLGIFGPLATILAAISGALLGLPAGRALPLYVAAVLSVAHMASTRIAGGINWQLAPWTPGHERFAEDEVALAGVFARFERWQAVRAGLQFLTFAISLWALVAATGA